MINSLEAQALAKWIKQWTKTYSEEPTLEECCTWFEWQFKDKNLSEKDIEFIKNILDLNSI